MLSPPDGKFPAVPSVRVDRPCDTRGAVLEIAFPEGGRLRARAVVSRSKARETGKHPSWKVGRMLQWESPAERDAFQLLDADPRVRAYCEQPVAIRYKLNGEVHTHIPDILVETAGARELWEVKYASDAADPFVRARTSLLERSLPRWGFTYRLVLAEELARQPRLSNVRTLLKYGRNPVSDLERERLRRLLLIAPSIRWDAALNGALGPRGAAIVCRLTLEGVLSLDLEQPLGPDSQFCLSNSRAGD